MGLSLLKNTIEGAVLEFTDQNLVRHLAFVPRAFFCEQISDECKTPEVDAWLKAHRTEVSFAVLNCNTFNAVAPPYDVFRALGSFT
ncbi:hypothetical protein RA26_08755 [Leisingera sp. ANG-M7]|nr:hypothetical protein RA26_08755 [Leisingera sp. ANG-M7]